MYYVTVMQSEKYKQMTFEQFLFGSDAMPRIASSSRGNTATRTYEFNVISNNVRNRVDTNRLISLLNDFNQKHSDLRSVPRNTLYREFQILKKSGGYRVISQPNEKLMCALRELKIIFEDDFGVLYHTNAYAYIKKRCTIDLMKKHQKNESKWFAKLDLHNFFGSTTINFVMKMFSMIFPFSEVVSSNEGKEALETALELAFLNGGLPQGTPISPLITNVMMIPIDFALSKKFRDFNGDRLIYTRYADDFIISSRYTFSCNDVEKTITETIKSFNAPFELNAKKTRYGSSSGANWNLGVMLNANNDITIGHKKKREFQSALNSYIKDKKNGSGWCLNDVQILNGQISYYKMVEGDVIDRIIDHIDQKNGTDVRSMIREDLRV